MLVITANKHQKQESLAGDEKSCLVMRGYEPFLSYLFGFCNKKSDVAAAAHAKQPVPKPSLHTGVPHKRQMNQQLWVRKGAASSERPRFGVRTGDRAALQQGGLGTLRGRTPPGSLRPWG